MGVLRLRNVNSIVQLTNDPGNSTLQLDPPKDIYTSGETVTIKGTIETIYFVESDWVGGVSPLNITLPSNTFTFTNNMEWDQGTPVPSGMYRFVVSNDNKSDPFQYNATSTTLVLDPPKDIYTSGETVTIKGTAETIYFVESDWVGGVSPLNITLPSNTFTFTNNMEWDQGTPVPSGMYRFVVSNDNKSDAFQYNVTPTPTYTSFHLSENMDTFFRDSTKTYEINMIPAINGYYCLTAYGSNGTGACSSEALSYCLDLYVYSYVMGIRQEDSRQKIIYILNTIFTLTEKITNDVFNNIIFPTWYFNTDCTLANPGSQGSATDSNIEIMTSLLYLYFYLYNNGLNVSSDGLKPFTFLGVSFSHEKTLLQTLKDVIKLFALNILDTVPAGPGYNAVVYQNSGSFAFYSDFEMSFNLTCQNCYAYKDQYSTYTYNNEANLISKGFGDYINSSGFILLSKFLAIENNASSSFTFTVTKPDDNGTITKPNSGANQQTKTVFMPSLDNAGLALNNYLLWIKTRFADGNIGDISYGDGQSATLNRLSYQLVNLYLFLDKGCKVLGMTECNDLWNSLVPNFPKSEISNLCVAIINYEKETKNKLYIDYDGDDSYAGTGKPTVYLDINANGFYRQLSYHIFKEQSDIDFLPKRPIQFVSSNSTLYYFENYSLDQYFGFNNVPRVIPNTFNDILNDYKTYSVNNVAYFSNPKDEQGIVTGNTRWKSDCVSWKGSDNAAYFMFSCCTLHQINYLLYKGIL